MLSVIYRSLVLCLILFYMLFTPSSKPCNFLAPTIIEIFIFFSSMSTVFQEAAKIKLLSAPAAWWV